MQGDGNAGYLLAAVQERHQGVALFPLLRGPKIRAMWVRMLVCPGHAVNITDLAALPVAVDTHVHRVTYYLRMPPYNVVPHPPYADGGVISGRLRFAISSGWQLDIRAYGAIAPPECPALANTAGALDPALWFVGKHGCKKCHDQQRWIPIHSPGFCDACRLNPNNAGSIIEPATSTPPALAEQIDVEADALAIRGQSFGTREGYQAPVYYRHEFRSAEQERDVIRRERTIREYYLSQGDERDDPDDSLVRDFTENQLRYEIKIGRWGSYSWRKIRNKGVVRSCIEWVLGPETDGFRRLVRSREGGLTTEALVIQHSDRFSADIIARAAQRVSTHAGGFPHELVELARRLRGG
jgi:hypothetical protein